VPRGGWQPDREDWEKAYVSTKPDVWF
jgi:hypothetical protein